MNMIRKCIAGLILVLLLPLSAVAQNPETHIVKEGETLVDIAKQYRITPYNLLRVNRDIKRAEDLVPGMVLVLPGSARVSQPPQTKPIAAEKASGKAFEEQRNPERFLTHKVRRKETLFGISRRYNITEEDIKRYNDILYAKPLKKGMWLQIPQYPEEVYDPAKDPENYDTYVVLPQETRWSIAHKYGITIDSLETLNPVLSEGSTYLAAGQELKVPKPETTLEEEVQLYESYTVPPKKTLYSLSKEYEISQQEIIKLNPVIMEAGGLKEGMVLRLPIKKEPDLEINTENYVFYVVKPKQTEYSLTRKLNMSYSELRAINPELSQGLKAGMVLKIPIEKSLDLDVKNALVLDKIDLMDSINQQMRPKILVMLPFRLNRIDVSNGREAINTIEKSNAMTYSFGLYTGLLVALDSIADLGISVDVKVIDTELSEDTARLALITEDLSRYNAIFGPLQSKALKEVAIRAKEKDIPVIAPLSAETDLSLSNVFYTVPTETVMRQRMLAYMDSQISDQNVIIIADGEHVKEKEQILAQFPEAQILELTEEEKNIAIDLDTFSILLSEEKENWVFVESDNFRFVSSISSILNSAITDQIKVRMFTTHKNKAFDNDVISGAHLSNLRFTYPSINRQERNSAFKRRYVKRFGKNPDRYAIRGFDIAFDMLLKLAYKPDLMEISNEIGVTEYEANKFNFVPGSKAGYYNTASYIMTYENMRIKEVQSP